MAVEVYFSEEQIATRIKEVADMINKDYAGQEVHIVGVLNGSFIFTADLVRQIKVPCVIDFMAASSYEGGTTSTGTVTIEKDIRDDIKGQNVILVEDIVDTGRTMKLLKEKLLERGPKSLKLCSLLYKPARLEFEVELDYLCFEIEDKFVIGYGLDFDGKYREMPYIGIYSDD